MEVIMEVLVLPALIIGIWLILSHLRRQQFLKEYMLLQNKALEKGVELPANLKEPETYKTNWPNVVLRIGIISMTVGIAAILIGIYMLPDIPDIANDNDAIAVFATIKIIGLLITAFGVGNLICWILIDKKQNGRDKSE
jgi:hypothetical protein